MTNKINSIYYVPHVLAESQRKYNFRSMYVLKSRDGIHCGHTVRFPKRNISLEIEHILTNENFVEMTIFSHGDYSDEIRLNLKKENKLYQTEYVRCFGI